MQKRLKTVILCGLLGVLSSCSISRMTTKKMTEAFAREESIVFTGDDDPELIGDALPFTLKFYESLLERDSTNSSLLLATGKLFVLYAQAYIMFPADTLPDSHTAVKKAMGKRAKKLLLRGRDYLFRGLDLHHPGISEKLRSGNPDSALSITTHQDTSLLYWSAVAWMSAIMADRSDLALAMSTKKPGALMSRVIELNDQFGNGSAHEFFAAYYAALPKALGGDREKSNQHFTKAIEYGKQRKVSPYVTLAGVLNSKNSTAEEFTGLLQNALAINTNAHQEFRLQNILYQQRARWMLANTNAFFPQKQQTTPENREHPDE